jgi:hypothetical protein
VLALAAQVPLRRDLLDLSLHLLPRLSIRAARRARVDANGVDDGIDAGTVGEVLHRRNRIVGLVVDTLGALLARVVEAVGLSVDGDDARRAAQQGARDCELADRPAAEDRHRRAGRDVRQRRAEPARREDVREEDGLVVRDLLRQLHEVEVRERDALALGLQPVERPA